MGDMSLVDLYCENHYDEILPSTLEAKIAKAKKRRAALGDQDDKIKKPKAWFNRKKLSGHPGGLKPRPRSAVLT